MATYGMLQPLQPMRMGMYRICTATVKAPRLLPFLNASNTYLLQRSTIVAYPTLAFEAVAGAAF